MTETKPVLVVGGTGQVGGKVVDELLAKGKERPGVGPARIGCEQARGQRC